MIAETIAPNRNSALTDLENPGFLQVRESVSRPTSGLTNPSTRVFTTAANAVPMTTATRQIHHVASEQEVLETLQSVAHMAEPFSADVWTLFSAMSGDICGGR